MCFCRLDAALDLEILVTKKYTGEIASYFYFTFCKGLYRTNAGSYFKEELKGLADAAGLDEKVKSNPAFKL